VSVMGDSFKGERRTQLAIYDVSNDDIPCILLTLHAHVGSIIFWLLCLQKRVNAPPQREEKEEV